tara:strand:- start:3495 stop:8003 length:4509 start_codon:yes stop_codon:yes gene_type:complete
MMDSIFDSDPTDFQETPYHLITTDHPWMFQLGLSTFTTGTLYRWWHKRDGNGKYENRKYFIENEEVAAQHEVPCVVLGGDDTEGYSCEAFDSFKDKTGEFKGQFSFQGWRKENDAGAGQYHRMYIDGGHTDKWAFSQPGKNEAGDPRSYSYEDLKVTDFDNAYIREDGELMDGSDDEHKARWWQSDGRGAQDLLIFFGMQPITNVIAMNDYVNNKILNTIDRGAKKEDGTPAEGAWTKTDFARSEFTLDIQSSKEGYVEWSGYVPFQISLGSGDAGDVFKCTKSDWVTFRLHLFPETAPKSTRRGIAMSKPSFAAPPVDSLGRSYQKREDGRFSPFPEGSQAAEVVGDLDMNFNEYTGKWEAGSPQMVGIVTQKISAAQTIPSDRLRRVTPEDMLRNPNDPNSHIIWGSGEAMSIHMQNSNPMQWTPNYLQPSNLDENGKFAEICPEDSEERATVRVFNASSKPLEVDQMCLLNRIDGLWFAIDFPSGVVGEDTVSVGFDGKWEFQYYATNVVHFFKNKDFTRIQPAAIEKGFHKEYYASKSWADRNHNVYQGATRISDFLYHGGFHQFSSFDFMDHLIAGTRDTNAYSLTSPLLAPNGDTIEGDTDGLHTGPFFGCCFPDGYSTEDTAKYLSDRTFIAKPTINVSGKVDGKWTPTHTHFSSTVTGGETEYKYFLEDGIAKDGRPFAEYANPAEKTGPRNDWNKCYKDQQNIEQHLFVTDGTNLLDASLSHLPADIALNASPSGYVNGQPLTNIHKLNDAYHRSNDSSFRSMDLLCKQFFMQGKNWLYKKYDDDDDSVGIKDFTESNAFDFKPNRPNRIMFRPLKAEAYSQFMRRNSDGNYVDPNAELGTRSYFNQSLGRDMKSQGRPSSDSSLSRELDNDIAQMRDTSDAAQGGFSVPNMAGNIYSIYNSFWGLQHQVDIPTSKSSDYLLSPNANLKSIQEIDFSTLFPRLPVTCWGFAGGNRWCHSSTDIDKDKYYASLDPPWRAYKMGDDDDQHRSGGVGIIAAAATCTLQDRVKFESTCRLGCWSYSHNNSPPYKASWGKGDNHDSFSTTNLFVRVYAAWPKEQTIYDGRYFAVHHFNAGILSETFEHDGDEWYRLESATEDITQKDPTDPAGGFKSYKYKIQKPGYDIDLLGPSTKVLTPSEDEVNTPRVAASYSRFYGLTTVEVANGASTVYESLPRSKWQVNNRVVASRRGKLLPFEYSYWSVQIPKFKIQLPWFGEGIEDGEEKIYKNGGYAIVLTGGSDNDGFLNAEARPFYDLTKAEADREQQFDPIKNPDSEDVVMVVRNPGDGGDDGSYKKGDTFVTPVNIGGGTQAIIKVADVVDVGEYKGKISTLEVSFEGTDFENTGFTDVDKDKPITKSSIGMDLSPGGSQPAGGRGFNAFLVRGENRPTVKTDLKPEIATSADLNRLSIKSEKISEQGGGIGGGGHFGLLSDNFEADIEITNKSPDNKYDLFFFFHNDITHTFAYGNTNVGNHWQRTGDMGKGQEQYIDLTITTN